MNVHERLARQQAERRPLSDRPLGCLVADVTSYGGDGYGESALVRMLFPSFLTDERIAEFVERAGYDFDGRQCACASTGGDCCGRWFSESARIIRGRRYVVVHQSSAVDC